MKNILSLWLTILLILCGINNMVAQKEANIWHFGNSNSLDFNQTSSVVDNNGILTPDMPKTGTGKIISGEGCFTLSTKEGELMMYSDGMTIWDKTNNPMPNGSSLLGGTSSTQSGIIVPFPGDPNKYYAISVAQNRGTAGITYSVVDMSLRSGLGDVTSTKNVVLRLGPTDENIAAVRKPSSDNYWIIHRDMLNSSTVATFYVWELTPTGFTSPVTYQHTTNFSGFTSNTYLGYLKFSSDAKLFVAPIGATGGLISGEFDPVTGQITNIQSRNNLGLVNSVYSAEFSLSGEQLFISADIKFLYHISWNDLRNTTKQATNLNKLITNVQMHPNGHIYATGKDARTLFVIMDPESGATADIRIFNNYLTNTAQWGLPTFAATFMRVQGDTDFCMNASAEFTMSISSSLGGGAVAFTVWDFGDGSNPEIVMGSGTQKKTHVYTRPDKYKISVYAYDAYGKALDSPRSLDVNVKPCVIPVNPNIHMHYNK